MSEDPQRILKVVHKYDCHEPRFHEAGSKGLETGQQRFTCTSCGLTVTVTPIPSQFHAEKQAYAAR